MQQKKGAKSSLLLIELIITLFFFLLISVVCIQIFTKTDTLSRRSRELNHAQNLVAGAAEVLEYAGTSPERWQTFFPEMQTEQNSFFICYDNNFAACVFEEAVYTLTIEFFPDETGNITFFKGEELVYSLEIRYHIPVTKEDAA